MTAIKDGSVADLDKLLTQTKSARNRLEPTWMLNLAYFQGNQWVFYNRGRLDRPKLDSNRVTITDNRIVGVVRTEVAKMTKQKPAWQVVPVTGDDGDQQAALTGEKILDFLWRDLDLRTKLQDVLLWSRITGAGFWKISWDNAKGKKVQILVDGEGKPQLHPQTGAPLRPADVPEVPEGLNPKTVATGEVQIETVSPFEVFPDPAAKSMDEAEFLIQVSVKSPEYVKQHFGVELEGDTDIAPGPVETRLFPMYDGGTGTSAYKGVKLQEYWCKPNSQHPEGRRVVWAKGKILAEGPNPYKCLPYVMFRGIPIPGRFWPTSITEQLRPLQTSLNKVESQIEENAQRMGNPAIMCSRQANVSYQGAVGERIDYDDTVQNPQPQYLVPPTMPQYVTQRQERIEQAMQDISGQHEVSNAQVPPGVKAASAISLLQEADDTRLGPAIYEMEETLGVGGSMLLKLVAQYWTNERTVMIAGEDHVMDAMIFRGAALKENTQVEVQSGSQFPKSKAAKQAAIENMLALRFQYQHEPMNNRMIGKVLKDLEAGGLEKLFGDISVDESQISRENQQIAQGAELPVNVYDNHQAHIEGHTEFQKEPTYGALGPVVSQMMERHVALHKQQLIAAMQGQGPQQTETPAESLNYKDAPPDIRRQIEKQAGLEPSEDESAGPVDHPEKPEPQEPKQGGEH